MKGERNVILLVSLLPLLASGCGPSPDQIFVMEVELSAISGILTLALIRSGRKLGALAGRKWKGLCLPFGELMEFHCVRCGAMLVGRDWRFGRRVKCQRCGKRIKAAPKFIGEHLAKGRRYTVRRFISAFGVALSTVILFALALIGATLAVKAMRVDEPSYSSMATLSFYLYPLHLIFDTGLYILLMTNVLVLFVPVAMDEHAILSTLLVVIPSFLAFFLPAFIGAMRYRIADFLPSFVAAANLLVNITCFFAGYYG